MGLFHFRKTIADAKKAIDKGDFRRAHDILEAHHPDSEKQKTSKELQQLGYFIQQYFIAYFETMKALKDNEDLSIKILSIKIGMRQLEQWLKCIDESIHKFAKEVKRLR